MPSAAQLEQQVISDLATLGVTAIVGESVLCFARHGLRHRTSSPAPVLGEADRSTQWEPGRAPAACGRANPS